MKPNKRFIPTRFISEPITMPMPMAPGDGPVDHHDHTLGPGLGLDPDDEAIDCSDENETVLKPKRKPPTRKPTVSVHADLKRALRLDRTIGDPVSTAIVALADRDFRTEFLAMLERQILDGGDVERRYFAMACGRVSNYTASKGDRFLEAIRGYLANLRSRPITESRDRVISAIDMFIRVWVSDVSGPE